ncbi:desampylase [Salarchaeum japonicum]|uniref:Desampylase n=1 Tax=Salarchaeum japonicum TaxID=555573 RepID=A0AAV3SYX1_9EURY|nr:desampylase [Salarchaeum japonicum]
MLALAGGVYDDVLAHAREDAPREACGILVGTTEAETATATVAHRVRNVADAPRVAYEMDATEQLRVFETAADHGREVVGFYHSHPAGPAAMSDRDRETAAWPGYRYLLVSLAGRPPFVGAWTWTGDDFERETVTVQN